MKKQINHIHKFRRKTYKTTGSHIYFCTLPDCYFKTEPDILIGKQSICNRCGNPFILNSYSIRTVKPHCDDCTIKRGNNYEQRVIKRRVKDDRREHESDIPDVPITAAVADLLAADTVTDLEQRLRSYGSDFSTEPIATRAVEFVVNDQEPIIKEYNPDEDEL